MRRKIPELADHLLAKFDKERPRMGLAQILPFPDQLDVSSG